MLLTVDNAKTSKGFKMGFYTGILYLAAHRNSRVTNVCPMADVAKCGNACLYKAGRGRFSSVEEARIKKTLRWVQDHSGFMNELVTDIQRIANTAKRLGMTPLIRLNGTSDIFWERNSVTLNLYTTTYLKRYGEKDVEDGQAFANVMELFPDVQFYDYTKIPTRTIPSNYDLTFSYSGVEEYQGMVAKAREKSMRVAVVFENESMIPDQFLGMPVVSGDDTDIRHLDPKGVVVSLYAKGPAKQDRTGFVVREETVGWLRSLGSITSLQKATEQI